MKILSLELKAFGPFSGITLDLSEGEEGLYIIYGSNEAGKSSALRALKALFYGIPERTRDNFIHANNNLRIGGSIRHSDGSILTFQRRKGRVNILLTVDENPLKETELEKYLGVPEELFSRMFGISHEELVAGGREIIQGQGSVGESIFTAGMGGGLREVLRELDEETDDLFKLRAQSKRINVKLNEFRKARDESAEASLPSREWERHTGLLKEAEGLKKEGLERLLSLKTDLSRLERIQKAIPLVAKLKEKDARRREMGAVVILPLSFPEERRNVLEKLSEAKRAEARARDQIGSITQKIRDLYTPEEILKEKQAITEIQKALGSNNKAMLDLPRLVGEEAQVKAEAENILKELRPDLSFDQVDALRLTVLKRQNIRSLCTSYSPLYEKWSTAKKTIESLQKKVKDTEDELKKIETSLDPGELKAIIKQVQKNEDIEGKLSASRAEFEVIKRQVAVDLKRLPLWSGALEDLEGLILPQNETIDLFEQDFGAFEKKEQAVEVKKANHLEECAKLDQKIKELELAGDVPDEGELVNIRKRRDHGWKLVREVWLEGKRDEEGIRIFDPELPLDQAFEKSFRSTDDVSDRLRREADRVAAKANLLAARERHLKELSDLETEREVLVEELKELNGKWRGIWSAAGMIPLTPKEMRAWSNRQKDLSRQAETVRKAKLSVEHLEKEIEHYKTELNLAIGRVGRIIIEGTLHVVLAEAIRIADEIASVKKRKGVLEENSLDLCTQLEDAKKEEEVAEGELRQWNLSWKDAVKDLGLPATTKPDVANTFLDKIQDLFSKTDEKNKLNQRIQGIERDSKQFEERVRAIAEEVSPDLIGQGTEKTASELNARLLKAQRDSATKEVLRSQYTERDKELYEARETIRAMTAVLDEMCRMAGCSSPEELEGIEVVSAEARALDDTISDMKERLLEFTAGATIDGLIKETESIEADTVASRIDVVLEDIVRCEKELSELDQKIWSEGTEISRMDGGSKAADAEEMAQSVLSQIKDYADRYVRLRLASCILREGIERYRSMNQGPILRRASEIFALITLNSFSGLKTNYDDNDNPALVGVRASGGEVRVEGMSDGTCDQLYLSLRLAFIEKLISENEPLPFIVDDIMIQFDDGRTEATLKALADISTKTQVIMFTHHSHLVEIAKRVVDKENLYIKTL